MIPHGSERVEPRGLDFYERLVDAPGVAGSTVLVQGDRADQVRVMVPPSDADASG